MRIKSHLFGKIWKMQIYRENMHKSIAFASDGKYLLCLKDIFCVSSIVMIKCRNRNEIPSIHKVPKNITKILASIKMLDYLMDTTKASRLYPIKRYHFQQIIEYYFLGI
jgi:hypothetical protein